ncbi:DUF6455 family protein [Salipiger sp. PrR002]|uniref:DUF6455 family protein n=1 Tax=Salipiger sp. PrR002 TaxID=2706489 RepID=UPI001941A26F|nr:DUF6455 family protein [Salipiger sp. PrR002]
MISACMKRGPRPMPLGDERAHFWRVQRMARATGVDLVAAQDHGLLPQSDWAAMVGRCRGCLWAEGCDRWLGHLEPMEAGSEGNAPRACPEDCVNSRTFAALQGELVQEV